MPQESLSPEAIAQLRGTHVKGERGLKCGDCGSKMRLRVGRFGRFYGCVKYPECRGTLDADDFTGKPNGIAADAETRMYRRRFLTAYEMAIQQKVYDAQAIRARVDNPKFNGKNGFGRLSKDECIRGIDCICEALPHLREIIDDIGVPPPSALQLLLQDNEL